MRCWSGIPAVLLMVCLAGCDEPAKPGTSAKPRFSEPGAVDADAPEEFTATESGLKYRFRRKGKGTKASLEKMIVVNYRGWLDDGMIFDTTYGTGGYPATLEPKMTVPGFQEAVLMMEEGSMLEVEIPAKLGYGERQSINIPANSTLHYLIELIKVTDPPQPPAETPSMGPSTPVVTGPVDPDAPEEFTKTASGLKYRIRRKSSGKKPTASNTVKVHYRGWLDNGTEFDSSYSRKEPASFGLRDVVAGWTEGLQLVGVGGMIELEVPSDLGYGDTGSPPSIPPKATLHFLVELLEIR